MKSSSDLQHNQSFLCLSLITPYTDSTSAILLCIMSPYISLSKIRTAKYILNMSLSDPGGLQNPLQATKLPPNDSKETQKTVATLEVLDSISSTFPLPLPLYRKTII